MHIDYSYNIDAKYCPFLASKERRSVGRCLKEKCAIWDHTRDTCGLKDSATWAGGRE